MDSLMEVSSTGDLWQWERQKRGGETKKNLLKEQAQRKKSFSDILPLEFLYRDFLTDTFGEGKSVKTYLMATQSKDL